MSRWLLRWKPRSSVVGIDAARIAWHDGDAVRVGEHAEAPQAFGAAQGAVDIVASNAVAVHWLQQPPAGVGSLAELKLAAAARCAHLHGGTPDDWWVAGDWSVRHPFVCAALPRALTQTLQDAAPGARIRWRTAFGLIVTYRASGIADDGWSAMRTPSRVVLWHCSAQRIDSLAALAVDPAAGEQSVAAQVRTHLQLESAMGAPEPTAAVRWFDSDRLTASAPGEAAAALALGGMLHGEAR